MHRAFGGTLAASNSSTSQDAIAAQKKLNSELDDLLGGDSDNWDHGEDDEGGKTSELSTMNHNTSSVVSNASHAGSTIDGAHTISSHKNSAKQEQTTSELDDDLFNLLSDDKDNSYTVKPKPKFRMKSSSSSSHHRSGPSSKTISKPSESSAQPIAAKENQSTVEVERTNSTEDKGRPKSRKGPMLSGKSTESSKSMSLPHTATSGSSGPDILTLNGSSGNKSEDTFSRTVMRDSRFAKKAHVVRDEGDDDILSGMGLDDGEMSNKSIPFNVHNKMQPSRVPDTTHSKPTPHSTLATTTNTRQDDRSVEKDLPFKSEEPVNEGSYMFGGYTPSVMSGPRQTGLPTNISSRGRQRQSLEIHSKPTVTVTSQSDNENLSKPTRSRQQQQQSEAVNAESNFETIVEPRNKPSRKSVRFAEVIDSATDDSSSHEVKTEHKAFLDGRTSKESSLEAPQGEVLSLTEDQTWNLKEKDPEPKLEHPVFPWQMKSKKRDSNDRTSVNPLHMQSASQKHSTPSLTTTESIGRRHLSEDNGDADSSQRPSSVRQHSEEDSEGSDTSSMKLYNKNQNSNANTIFSEDREHNGELKARVKSLESQLEISEQQRKCLADRLEKVKSVQQRDLQSKELELTSQLEELKMKVHILESDKEQLQLSLESLKTLHREEQATMEKSHSTRVQSLEEAFQQREEKWKEELKIETSHHKERLEQLERDQTDALLTLRKKIESLEITKTNEIAQLQKSHRSTVADMKREHELDLQHVKDLHRQEMEAMKATHSHTQHLSELSSLVEDATKGVSVLHNKVEQAHKQRMEDSQQSYQAHLQHLKTLEDRLSKQYRDMENERDLLQSLTNKLETHLTQQTQAVEEEQWTIQQERARLKAGEKALEDDKRSFLSRLDQERRDLVQMKERFIAEQQKILSECLNERHSLASERAQLTVEQHKIIETETRDEHRRHTIESELEAALAKATEKQIQLVAKEASLKQKEAKLKAESLQLDKEKQTVEREKESLLEQRRCVETRAVEADKLNQSALDLQREGKQMMETAQRERDMVTQQLEIIKMKQEVLDQRETQLASERLAFASECREHENKYHSLSPSLIHDPNTILASTKRPGDSFLAPLSPLNLSTLTQSLPQPLSSRYSSQYQQTEDSVATPSSHQTEQARRKAWTTDKDEW